jgi:hypothetical protein
VNRNQDIRRILESREIAQRQREETLRIQRERDEKRGCSPGLDPDNLYVRDSRFPWK